MEEKPTKEDIARLKEELLKIKPEWNKIEKRLLKEASLRRYLRATEFDIQASKTMVLNTLKWRQEFGIDLLSARQIERHFKQGKNYHHGTDYAGRPVAVMRVRLDSNEDIDGKLKIMLYQIERAIRLMDKSKGVEQAVWLVDCADFPAYFLGPSHYGDGSISIAMSIVLTIILHHLQAFWKILIPFVSKTTTKKFVFIKKPNELLEYIPADQLEREFGGSSDFTYNHEEYFKMLFAEEDKWLAKNKRIIEQCSVK